MVSIFEPHTAVIRRGKAAKPTEFGRKVWISEVEGGIVSSYRILDGNPDDVRQMERELGHHLRLFGASPQLLAADRGCYSADNERLAEELRVRRVYLSGAKRRPNAENTSNNAGSRVHRDSELA